LFAEVAGLEPCLGGAGPYEVRIVIDWHRAKGVVRRWKSEATLTFRRLFTSMSNRLHLGPPPRPRLKMQGGWQVNRQSQRCSHCLNQSLRRPQTLLRESSLFDLALLGASNRKYNVCGSAPSEPHTKKLKRLWALTHLHVINCFVHA